MRLGQRHLCWEVMMYVYVHVWECVYVRLVGWGKLGSSAGWDKLSVGAISVPLHSRDCAEQRALVWRMATLWHGSTTKDLISLHLLIRLLTHFSHTLQPLLLHIHYSTAACAALAMAWLILLRGKKSWLAEIHVRGTFWTVWSHSVSTFRPATTLLKIKAPKLDV